MSSVTLQRSSRLLVTRGQRNLGRADGVHQIRDPQTPQKGVNQLVDCQMVPGASMFGVVTGRR
jgi:hypothetical protein